MVAHANVKNVHRTYTMTYVLIMIVAIIVATFQVPVPYCQETGIVVSNGKTRIIENVPAILTGDVLVEKNSTLIMRNVLLQLSVRGEKGYNIVIKENSTLIVRRSDITSLHRASNITIAGSSALLVEDDSSIEGFQSITLENASLVSFKSVTLGIGLIFGSINRLELSRVNAAASTMNVSSGIVRVERTQMKTLHLRTTQLNALNLRVENLKMQCGTGWLNDIQAETLILQASGDFSASNVRATMSNMYTLLNGTIRDSVFGTLTVGLRAQLYNVTTSRSPLIRAGGMVYTHYNSTVIRYWVLKVNVTDITMLPVPAIVEIRDYNMTLIDSAKVAPDGTISKPLVSEIIANSTKFIGNYRVSAHYRNYATKQETVVLDINKKMNLVFSDEIPGLASVTLSITPLVIFAGDKATVKGKIRTPMKDQVVELTYVTPDGVKLVRAAATDKDGAFTDEVTLDSPGKWRLQAYWLGGEPYSEGMASISRTMIFQVSPRQSLLNVLVFLIPVLIIVIATIIAFSFLFLRKGESKKPPRPTKPGIASTEKVGQKLRKKRLSLPNLKIQGITRMIHGISEKVKLKKRHEPKEQTDTED